MKNTLDTLIIPCAFELTPAGRVEAERILTARETAYEAARMAILPCGCYPGACYCGEYPTAAQWRAMQAESVTELPFTIPTDAEVTEAEELRNFFGGRHDA